MRGKHLALRNKYEHTERIYDEDRERLTDELSKWREETKKEQHMKAQIEDERERLQEVHSPMHQVCAS